MINGKIRTIGSALDLKNKYGNQYMAWVTLSNNVDNIDQEHEGNIEGQNNQIINDEIMKLIDSVDVNWMDEKGHIQFNINKRRILSIVSWLDKNKIIYKIDEVKFNMIKLKFEKNNYIMSQVFSKLNELERD